MANRWRIWWRVVGLKCSPEGHRTTLGGVWILNHLQLRIVNEMWGSFQTTSKGYSVFPLTSNLACVASSSRCGTHVKCLFEIWVDHIIVSFVFKWINNFTQKHQELMQGRVMSQKSKLENWDLSSHKTNNFVKYDILQNLRSATQ